MSNNAKKDLLLICNHFPFGNGETFLANEFPYLHMNFRKIVILVQTDEKNQAWSVPNDVNIIKIPPSKSPSKIKLSALLFKYLNLLTGLLKKEVSTIFSVYGNKPNVKQLKQVWHDALKSIELASFIKKNILSEISDNAVIYSCWQDSAAVAALLVKKEFPAHKVICRAHRGDLYFYSQNIRYRFFSARSILSTGMFIVGGVVIKLYFENFSRYNILYGSIGSLIILLVWIYYNAFIILIGFELNVSIRLSREEALIKKRYKIVK